jgi:hypothetical protein
VAGIDGEAPRVPGCAPARPSRPRGAAHRRQPLSALTPSERGIVRAHRTPLSVQAFLRTLAYNWELDGKTLRTFRGVVKHREANCLEAALTAAAILDRHGYPPLVLDLESQDELDHELFLFRHASRWGTVGKSRDLGLFGRRPVFRTIRDLVMSYFDPFVDGSGRIVGYGIAHLDELVRGDWRLSGRNVWEVERALFRMPHRRLRTPDRRYERVLRRYQAFRERGRVVTTRALPELYGSAVRRWW